jgi:general secretion pathway protein G
MKRSAFTMIELVFIIVVIAILAGIAIPKMAATRDDAEISKGRAAVAAIRSGIIAERQKRLLRGQTNFISDLGAGFANVLDYPVDTGSKRGQWSGMTYHYGNNKSCTFTYDSTTGVFATGSGDCDPFN